VQVVAEIIADTRAAGQGETEAGDNNPAVIDPDDAIIELITDQRIAIGQADGAGRQRRRIAERVGVGGVLRDDRIRGIDLERLGIAGMVQ